jgi:hypothetical protein
LPERIAPLADQTVWDESVPAGSAPPDATGAVARR